MEAWHANALEQLSLFHPISLSFLPPPPALIFCLPSLSVSFSSCPLHCIRTSLFFFFSHSSVFFLHPSPSPSYSILFLPLFIIFMSSQHLFSFFLPLSLFLSLPPVFQLLSGASAPAAIPAHHGRVALPLQALRQHREHHRRRWRTLLSTCAPTVTQP